MEYFYCKVCEKNTKIIVMAEYNSTGVWCNGCGLMIPKGCLRHAGWALLEFIESWSNIACNSDTSYLLPYSLREDLGKMLSKYYHVQFPKIDQRKE